mmetsp:Transcript_37196/g.117068  ORF Transcript_37196/g.117068 Transcript_37196/m.117068 type:complete len:1082 (+) Transcript_37196:459-3704(+)
MPPAPNDMAQVHPISNEETASGDSSGSNHFARGSLDASDARRASVGGGSHAGNSLMSVNAESEVNASDSVINAYVDLGPSASPRHSFELVGQDDNSIDKKHEAPRGGGGELNVSALEKHNSFSKKEEAKPRPAKRNSISVKVVEIAGNGNKVVDDLDDTGSHASSSQSSSLSQSLLIRGNVDLESASLPRFMIHPMSPRYRSWYWATILFVVYSAIMTPLGFAFLNVLKDSDCENDPKELKDQRDLEDLKSDLDIVDSVIDAIFFIDIVLTFCTAFHDEKTGDLITNRKRVALNYLLSFKFVMDCLATFPFDKIGEALPGVNNPEEMSYLGLLRLIRLNRLARVFTDAEQNVRFNYTKTRLLKFATIVLFVGHWSGCLMYFIAFKGCFDDDTWVGSMAEGPDGSLNDQGLFTQYVTSMYWAITTLSTVGYGDISPVSNVEKLITVFYMIMNLGLSSYLLGNMTMLLTRADQSTGDYRMQVNVLEKFMSRNAIPPELVLQMRSFLQLQFEARDDNEDILLEFPRSVRTRVLRFLYKHVVESVYFVNGCEPNFIDGVLTNITTELFMPNSWIIQQWDMANEMYIVASGQVDVFVTGEDGKHERIMRLSVGDPVGEGPFVCSSEHSFSYKCHGMTRTLILGRDAYKELQAQFPKDTSNITKLVLERMKEMRENFSENLRTKRESNQNVSKTRTLALEAMGEVVEHVQRQMDQNKLDAVGAFCHAASVGNITDLRRLIAGGLNPSSTDYDNRSALHVAAGKDQVSAVRYLLDHGANPNIIDHFGRTPLLEAIQAGNDSAAEMLKMAGAGLGLKTWAYLEEKNKALQARREGRASGADEQTLDSQQPIISAGGEVCDAASTGEMDYLRRLIRFGVDPSEGDYDRRTALHLASVKGQVSTVEILLFGGANPSSFDNFGRTPLLEAVRHGNDGVAKLLYKHGAKLGLKDNDLVGRADLSDLVKKNNGVPLHKGKIWGEPSQAPEVSGEMCNAVFINDVEYLTRLLKFGANPNAADYDARTSLHICACEGKIQLALLLLDAGAQPDIQDRWGNSPLDDAKTNGHTELLEVLRKYVREKGGGNGLAAAAS